MCVCYPLHCGVVKWNISSSYRLRTTSSACRSKSCAPVCSINVRSIDRRPIVLYSRILGPQYGRLARGRQYLAILSKLYQSWSALYCSQAIRLGCCKHERPIRCNALGILMELYQRLRCIRARISDGTCGAALFSKRPNVPVTCPRKTACRDAEVYASRSTQLIRLARTTCANFGANMKEKHPGQHVHGHRSLHTQAMTRLFLLDFGNPRPGQDLDRPQ